MFRYRGFAFTVLVCFFFLFPFPVSAKDSAPTTGIGFYEEAIFLFEEPPPPPVSLPEQKKTEARIPAPRQAPARPRVALIIDDMGYHGHVDRQFIQLDLNLTFSFLPYTPFCQQLAELTHQRKRAIMVHMPMEPHDAKWNIGPDALYLRQSSAQWRQLTHKMLTSIPHAIGANNHMGSAFTQNTSAMRTILEEIKKEQFFFIDSYTTSQSQGMALALKMGIPTGKRHIFIDNIRSPTSICKQITALVHKAKKDGSAIGIGHPYPETLRALQSCGQTILSQVDVVGAHLLVQ